MPPPATYTPTGLAVNWLSASPSRPAGERARRLDMILRGRPVSEVPFYRATKWERAVNLKTAKALGLKIPLSILTRADLVIE
jgi:putative ABC transport system substrate-binding protein